MPKQKKKSFRKRTRAINGTHNELSARKKKPETSRIVGARATALSEVGVITGGFESRFDTSRIDDLESRNGGFEIGCSDFEDVSEFYETETDTEDALEGIFLPKQEHGE